MTVIKTRKHPAKVKRRSAKIRAAIGGPIFEATKGSKEQLQTTLFVVPEILNEVKNLPDGKLTVTLDFTKFIQNAKPEKRGQVQAAIGGPILGEIFRQLNLQRTTSVTAASASPTQATCGAVLGPKKPMTIDVLGSLKFTTRSGEVDRK